MADNVESASGSGGPVFIAANFTWSGDDAYAPGCFMGILSGSEGSWTFTNLVGGAGAVGAGVQRMTLASDDPAVSQLTTLNGKVTACNTGAVVVSSSALPSGAATAANQSTANTTLSTINGKITACDTGSVAIASSALPTGAATSSKQDTIISSLSSIDGHVDGVEGSLSSIDAKITAVNTGAVVIASSALPTGAATAARQDTGNASLSSIDGKIPSLGQALAAASVPVVLTAAQLSTLTPLSTVAATQSGTWNVTNISGTISLPTGAATESTLSTLNGKVTACNTGAVTISAALPAGTNAIGKLAANSGVDIGDVDVTSQPARAATTDTITAKLATDTIQNGTTALTPKFAKIAASSSGNNTLVSAVVGKKIRVLAYNFIGNGAVNAKFQDGAGGTDLTGLKYIAAAGGGICAPFNPVGWFEGGTNTLLNLNLSGAVAVGGEIVYVEV